jgi:hypothetical protein
MRNVGDKLSVYAFATFAVLAILAAAFGAGYLIGHIFL